MTYHEDEGRSLQVLFSVEQTGEILGIGRTKTFELLSSGALGSVTIGTRRLVSRGQIEAFVEQLERPTGP
jgi:excisionase family DNA binding protein